MKGNLWREILKFWNDIADDYKGPERMENNGKVVGVGDIPAEFWKKKRQG